MLSASHLSTGTSLTVVVLSRMTSLPSEDSGLGSTQKQTNPSVTGLPAAGHLSHPFPVDCTISLQMRAVARQAEET